MPRYIAGTLACIALALVAATSFAATGGPDAGGYRFIDNAEQNGPDFAYEDISSTGTAIAFPDPADDEVSPSILLGFSFTFYGNAYTETTISTNGNLQFGTAIDVIGDGPIPVSGNNPPWERTIFVFGDDLDPGECGDVYHQTLGVEPSRRFIVQWDTCTDTQPNGALACAGSFQVILFEGTNHILMQYADTTFSEPTPEACDGSNPNSHDHGADDVAVGIQSSETSGLNYPVSQTVPNIIEGLVICFYHDPDGTLTEGFCGSTNDADTACDFTIDKTNDLPDPTAVPIGATFTWTLTVAWDEDCDDVTYDITDDVPDTMDVIGVTVVSNDGDDFTCNNADPVLCDDAMTFADPGTAVVEIDIEISDEVCGDVVNEAAVTPDDPEAPEATGDTDTDTLTMTVDCPDDGEGESSLTVAKACPFGAGLSAFTIEVEDAEGDVTSEQIACGQTIALALPAGDATLSELIEGPDAAAFATAIACGDHLLSGLSVEITLVEGDELDCVVLNVFGLSPLVLDLLIDNSNTNEIDIDNSNANNNDNDNANQNANNNDNSNENDNENTNTQDQTNDQGQDNSNTQENNITSSPEVNIDFD
jgi:hypothetical protein